MVFGGWLGSVTLFMTGLATKFLTATMTAWRRAGSIDGQEIGDDVAQLRPGLVLACRGRLALGDDGLEFGGSTCNGQCRLSPEFFGGRSLHSRRLFLRVKCRVIGLATRRLVMRCRKSIEKQQSLQPLLARC